MPKKRIDENEKKVPVGTNIKKKYIEELKKLAKEQNIPYATYLENIVVYHLKNLKNK